MKSVAERAFAENIALIPLDPLRQVPQDPQTHNLNAGLLDLTRQVAQIHRAQEQLALNMAHISKQIALLAQQSRQR